MVQVPKQNSFSAAKLIDELESYLPDNFFVLEEKSTGKPKLFHCFEYWKDKSKTYGLIAKHAMVVHGIPASSGNIERVFSTATDILSAKRNRMKSDVFESLLFIKRNVRAMDL